MDTLYPRCAGIDVHKNNVVVCVRCCDHPGKVNEEVRTFSTMTRDLLVLADWLAQHGVTHVAMESTGVYWKPVFNLLEGGVHVLLVNAEHIKQVPGRKTDVKDCPWIAQLLQHGLLKASFAKAPEGGEDTGPNPTARGKSGSKHHVLTDGQGIPLSATVTAANINEVTQALKVLLNLPPVGGKPGPKRQKPGRLQGDRAYDSEPLRQILRWLGINPVLAARNTEHGSGLGVFRWFVERTISWLHAFGRLRRRLDRLTEIQEAFLQLACDIICLRFVIT
jgi:transposase